MRVVPVLFVLLLIACTSPKASEDSKEGYIPDSWIKERVTNSENRLQQSDGGRKVWKSIEAHGGLKNWYARGPIRFHFDYKPEDGSTRRNTYQTVDQWSIRSVHELASNREVKFGWDGENAWIWPDTVHLPINPRFWANTPFYFLGLPFVLADEGIIYHDLQSDSLNGHWCDLVKVTFEHGTGDAPDDFYVLYMDHSSHLQVALRYVVSYPGFFPEGEHSPEKIMVLKELQEVDGISLAVGYRTYWWREQVGDYITDIDVSEVSFEPDLPKEFFSMPSGAKIQDGFKY